MLPLLLLASCQILPDEFNLSPLYRHRVDPAGNLAELDILWPLIHYERSPEGDEDFRIRPFWRRTATADGKTHRYEFLVPLGAGTETEHEFMIRLSPLFYYREHEDRAEPGAWDRDWFFTPLIWGGSSRDGESYFAFFPFFGKLKQFLTYDELGFVLFPLFLWTERERDFSRSILWPFGGWGGERAEGGASWWRILPLYGQNLDPGKREHYTLLWPILQWGRSRLDQPDPLKSFWLFPLFGWEGGGAFVSWSVLWPFFRHAHEVEGGSAPEEGKKGRYTYWDLFWPIFRWIEKDLPGEKLDQWWIMPLVSRTRGERQESTVLLWPLIWLRRFWAQDRDRRDHYFLPLYWDHRIRYREVPGRGATGEEQVPWLEGEDRTVRLYPLYGFREERSGAWRHRALAPWPFDGMYAGGVEEAWDWTWTLWESAGDGRGNRRTRTFMNFWTSRNFAGRRWQASVPFLFNVEVDEEGEGTLRLFQFLPIRW